MADHTALLPPEDELRFRFSRSGGPGGQHVNTSATRVEALWDLSRSRAITNEQRAILTERLAHRVDGDGGLRVVSGASRSQHDNRREAVQRMRALVSAALAPPRRRKPTKPRAAARKRRMERKRKHSEKKGRRRPVDW